MLTIVRESFEERYQKYRSDPEHAMQYMQERLKHMPLDELAYLLAEHDKFYRLHCKEYEDCPEGYNPVGKYVDSWGRPKEKPKEKRKEDTIATTYSYISSDD